MQAANEYELNPAGAGGGPFLKYLGSAVTVGGFGPGIAPVGAVKTTIGYEVAWSLGQLPVVPMLQLTFYLRPEVDPAGLSFDVLRFFQGLSQYERELGGTGLRRFQENS